MVAPREISIYDAAVWLTRMAAADGVVTIRERKIMERFAVKYGIDVNMMCSMAESLAADIPAEVVCLGEEYDSLAGHNIL